ncbi:hypothetical protein TYRP_016671, partial [Tyrophagus putrescentiae]
MGIAQSDGSWLIMSRKKGNDKDNQNEKKSKPNWKQLTNQAANQPTIGTILKGIIGKPNQD